MARFVCIAIPLLFCNIITLKRCDVNLTGRHLYKHGEEGYDRHCNDLSSDFEREHLELYRKESVSRIEINWAVCFIKLTHGICAEIRHITHLHVLHCFRWFGCHRNVFYCEAWVQYPRLAALSYPRKRVSRVFRAQMSGAGNWIPDKAGNDWNDTPLLAAGYHL